MEVGQIGILPGRDWRGGEGREGRREGGRNTYHDATRVHGGIASVY